MNREKQHLFTSKFSFDSTLLIFLISQLNQKFIVFPTKCNSVLSYGLDSLIFLSACFKEIHVFNMLARSLDHTRWLFNPNI